MTYTNSVDRVAMMELRQAQARRMRSTGMTYAAIGRELGLSESTVHAYVSSYNQQQPTVTHETRLPDVPIPCRAGRDPEIWFMHELEGYAKKLCQGDVEQGLPRCPIIDACRDREMKYPPSEQWGVYGGMSQKERVALKRKQAKVARAA